MALFNDLPYRVRSGALLMGSRCGIAALACAISLIAGAPSAAGSRPSARAAATGFSVSISGPSQITLSRTSAPPRFGYDISIAYVGPTLTAQLDANATIQLSDLVMNPGSPGVIPGECAFPPSGVPGGSISCRIGFGPGVTSAAFRIEVRPTGKPGIGTTSISLATGESASWSTTFVQEAAPAPAPTPPPTTVTETFTSTGETKTESATIAPTTKSVQVALTWPDAGSSFDITGIQIVRDGAVVARALLSASARPKKLTVTKIRRRTSLQVRVKGVTHGKLKFKIVAKKLRERTRIKATIRQSKSR
jgi:hypothetical protein